MAKLEIELSEYDAMREARKAAEARVEELKQENKELRSSSKVIIRRETKYLTMMVSPKDLELEILERLRFLYERRLMSIGLIHAHKGTSMADDYPTPQELAGICMAAWSNLPKNYSPIAPASEIDFPSKNDTLVGFEDIRMNVENMFKEQFQQEQKGALENLRQERAEYEKKRSQVSKELTRQFEAEYGSQIEELSKKVGEYELECKRQDETIENLNKQIEELSKSQDVKIKEAEEKVRQAQEELAKVKGKKSWWRR